MLVKELINFQIFISNNNIFSNIPEKISFSLTKNCSLRKVKNKNFSISKNNIVYAKAAKVLKYTYWYVHVGTLSNYPVITTLLQIMQIMDLANYFLLFCFWVLSRLWTLVLSLCSSPFPFWIGAFSFINWFVMSLINTIM